jgi:hypothetical protein
LHFFNARVPTMELREIRRECYCGGPATYHCRACQSKHYCSKSCQRRDWPLHRGQCSNESLLSTFVDGRAPDVDLVEQHRHLMTQPHWRRWLEIVYGTLRQKAGEFAGPEEYGVFWIGIVGEASPVPVPVAYVWLAAEKHQLYMHVYDVARDEEWGRPGESALFRRDILLDDTCVVMDLEPDKKPAALFYPMNLTVPQPGDLEMVVDWSLRPSG